MNSRNAIAIIIVIFAFPPVTARTQPKLHQLRVEKMQPLQLMAGDWILNSEMIPPGRPRIGETGVMHCRSMYDSTYVECDISLTNQNGRKRGYRQFITFNPDSSRYEMLYLYTGTAMRVLEYGQLTNGVLETKAMLNLAGGRVEIMDGFLKLIDRDELYYESRSSETKGEVDYTCRFIRKK